MNFWLTSGAIFIGFLLDCCFGDPHWLWHPIRLIGTVITKLERLLRKMFDKSARAQLFCGVLIVLIVLMLSFGVPFFLLWIVGQTHPILRLVTESIFCYQILAAKSLKVESMKVYTQIKKGDLDASRKAVSMIVGRDTKNLSFEEVTKAAIETVAENTSDGVVAPLLFLMIGGAPMGFLYKAVNTMDSMLGYKNERYLYFGRFAAKLDDVCNFIPARISAWLMILSSKLLGYHWKDAKRIFLRDRFCHASPNSAQTEAVCAGALQIQLAGDAYYFGKRHEKPTIGDVIRPVEPEDIVRSNRLMYVTALLTLAVVLLVRIGAVSLFFSFFGSYFT